jgi:hypothetical protein
MVGPGRRRRNKKYLISDYGEKMPTASIFLIFRLNAPHCGLRDPRGMSVNLRSDFAG